MISKSRLTRSCIIFLTLLFGLFGSGKVMASHYAAVDLYMDYIGSGPSQLKYQVTLVVYKACEPGGSALSLSETVSWNSSCAAGGSRSISQPLSDTLDQLCPGFTAINSCRVASSPWFAFIRKIYSDTITVPVACSDWTFSWTSSARNGGVVNLFQPASSLSITVKAQINNVLHYNNSSPRFVVDPIPYFCANQPTLFFNGPVDPNVDSLRTVAVYPMGCTSTGPTGNCLSPIPAPPFLPGEGAPLTPIVFTGTYSLANPIASSNGYVVEPFTGIAQFTPTLVGKFVVAFRCYEYDRSTGTLLGFITRDVQVAVFACNSAPPKIDSVPVSVSGGAVVGGAGGSTILTCPGAPLTFQVNSTSQTISNSLTMTANVTPPQTFTVVGQGTGTPVGTFAWTPTFADIGDHTLVIESKDSTCSNNQPIVFRSYLVVIIKVVQGIDAGQDRYGYCALDGVPIQLGATGPPGIHYNWYWDNNGTQSTTGINNTTVPDPFVLTNQTRSFVVYTNDLPSVCKIKDTIVVNIDNANSVTITPAGPQAAPFVLCRPNYLQLDANAFGPPPIQNIPCGVGNPVTCSQEDSNIVNVPYNAPPITTNTNTNSSPFYSNTYTTMRHQYLIKAADLLGSGVKSGTFNSLTIFLNGLGTGVSSFDNFKISLKCVPPTVALSSTTGFQTGTSLVYTSPGTITLNPGPSSAIKFTFDTPYSWDTTQNILVDICYSNAAATGSVYTNNFTGLSYVGTLYAFATTGSVCGSGGTVFQVSEIPQFRFNYCRADTAPFQYTWYPGTFISDSTLKSPVAYIPHSTKYYVFTRGRAGCKVIDSISIYVPVHHFSVSPKDTAICENEKALIHALPDNPNMKYKWYQVDPTRTIYSAASTLDDDTLASPIAAPKVPGDYTYAVSMFDSVGCGDTLFIKLKLKQLPVVNILNHDTIIKYGSSIQLLVTGAYLYSWSPVGTLTDPNVVNPVANPTEPTMYVVSGIASNGCRNVDSVKISIDYRGNLLVPSAFTPNGDGKNDEFKVVNLTFQKVLEFRVFNRWGQEIFSTTDPKKGWDGKWKGVDQDMAAYNYIIRVAYPDGFVETYKGDVTLIR